ncbi:MAG: calcium/sodium antiporter [Gammaproteobacteria bacterium]
MLIALAWIVVGLVVLTYGADRFIEGAAATASNFGVPPLLIGLVVVGFATSAPEMLVSAMAAVNGSPTLGIGNALGSNIANIGLVLGVTAVIAPLAVGSTVLRREFPMMFVVLLLATALLWDLELDRVDGIVLMAGLVVMIGLTVWIGRHAAPGDPLVAEFDQELERVMSHGAAASWLLVGLALLLAGSHLLVDGAVTLARLFGVSDVVIGLTIVAIGTSLPELAAAVMSALKNEPDIALGNVLGSNMFNALGVLAMPGLIAPTGFDAVVFNRDVVYMLVLSLALAVFAWSYKRPGMISRVDGFILLGAFFAYQGLLFAQR